MRRRRQRDRRRLERELRERGLRVLPGGASSADGGVLFDFGIDPLDGTPAEDHGDDCPIRRLLRAHARGDREARGASGGAQGGGDGAATVRSGDEEADVVASRPGATRDRAGS